MQEQKREATPQTFEVFTNLLPGNVSLTINHGLLGRISAIYKEDGLLPEMEGDLTNMLEHVLLPLLCGEVPAIPKPRIKEFCSNILTVTAFLQTLINCPGDSLCTLEN